MRWVKSKVVIWKSPLHLGSIRDYASRLCCAVLERHSRAQIKWDTRTVDLDSNISSLLNMNDND